MSLFKLDKEAVLSRFVCCLIISLYPQNINKKPTYLDGLHPINIYTIFEILLWVKIFSKNTLYFNFEMSAVYIPFEEKNM